MSNLNPSKHKLVVGIEESVTKPLTPTQRKFNANIKKIEKQKALLTQWQVTADACQQDVVKKLQPLKRIFADHQAEMVHIFDHTYNTQKLTKAQKEKMQHLISSLCIELIDGHGRDEFKAIYNRYQDDDEDFDTQEQMRDEMLRNMLEEAFGIQLDDDTDINDQDAIAKKLFEKQEAMQQQAEENRAQRRKTAKQLAKEAKAQEEQVGISKSIQAVYRQLVGVLHPDREPDAAERDRKTALMQEITVAYEKKDLLKLLELQLSVEQINQDSIYNIAEERLKHFIKVLDAQYQELKEEVAQIEIGYRSMLNIPYYESLTPKRLLQLLKDDIRRLDYQSKQLAEDVRLFKQDPSYLKLWLKNYQIEPDYY